MSTPSQANNKENYLGKRNPPSNPPGAVSTGTRNEKLFKEGNFVALMQTSEDLYKFLTKKSNLVEETVGSCVLANDKVSFGCLITVCHHIQE